MKLVQFIIDNFKGSNRRDDVLRCLAKSTIVEFEDDKVFVANDEYVYYFGTIPSKRRTKELLDFYLKHKSDIVGKLFYSYDTTPYSNRLEVVDKSKRLYRWKD